MQVRVKRHHRLVERRRKCCVTRGRLALCAMRLRILGLSGGVLGLNLIRGCRGLSQVELRKTGHRIDRKMHILLCRIGPCVDWGLSKLLSLREV